MRSFAVGTLICVSLMGFMASAQALHNPQKDYPGSPEKPLTEQLISDLYYLNAEDRILEAWTLLAVHEDGYAESATKIFGKKTTVERCVVESNWKVVVGEETRTRLYSVYAKLFQSYYIDFLYKNHRYPNSLDIETMYQRADDELGLPQTVSVDLLFNLVPQDWKRRVFFDNFSSLVGVGRLADAKRWYDYTKLSKARVVADFIVAQNVSVEESKEIYKKTTVQVARCMAQKLKPFKKGTNE